MARASPFRNFSLAIPTESIPRSRKINQVTPHIYAEGILGMNGITIKDPYTKRCMMPYTNHLNIGFTFALRCQLAPPKKRGLHKPQLEKVVKTNYIFYSCVKRHYLICVKKKQSLLSFVLKVFGSVWCTVKVLWCQSCLVWHLSGQKMSKGSWRKWRLAQKAFLVEELVGVKALMIPVQKSFGVKDFWCRNILA